MEDTMQQLHEQNFERRHGRGFGREDHTILA